jgi:hypothetical protein
MRSKLETRTGNTCRNMHVIPLFIIVFGMFKSGITYVWNHGMIPISDSSFDHVFTTSCFDRNRNRNQWHNVLHFRFRAKVVYVIHTPWMVKSGIWKYIRMGWGSVRFAPPHPTML